MPAMIFIIPVHYSYFENVQLQNNEKQQVSPYLNTYQFNEKIQYVVPAGIAGMTCYLSKVIGGKIYLTKVYDFSLRWE
jgi:hypothetical protein